MNFLGHLGIDIKLLVAQIINFGLLLWILNKFLYKPVMKKIEEEEEEPAQAKAIKNQLIKEREDFLKQQKAEVEQYKKEAWKIIQEAELVAKNITKNAQEEQKKLKQQIINQTQAAMESKEEQAVKAIKDQVSIDTKTRVLVSLKSIISPDDQKALDQMFFNHLIDDIKKENFNDIKSKVIDISESLSALESKSDKNKKASEKELQELVQERLGPINLEYAVNFSQKDQEAILDALEKKLGLEKFLIDLKMIPNKNLVSGFRLEVLGRVFEHNLLYVVNYAS